VSDFLIPSAEGETRCLLAATSLAIERYRLRHAGEVPLGLEELVPQFLAEVPRDPFDGQPLRYKRMVAGYRVYSVGWNEEDEGGDAASPPPSFRGRKAEKDIAFGVER
jgi:hypothetical protein